MRSGQEVENINLRLSRVGTVRVRGQVTSTSVAGVGVSLRPAGDMPFAVWYQGKITDGKFEIGSVPPGAYNLVVTDSSAGMQHLRWVRRSLTVGNADVDGIAVGLPAAGSIEGKIVVEAGGKVDPDHVHLRVEPAAPNNVLFGNGVAQLAPNGIFRITDLAPDRYRIRVSAPGSGLYLKEVRTGGRELPGGILELGAAAELEVVLSSRTAAVTGMVRAADSDIPGAGATVVLIPQDEERIGDIEAYPVAIADESGKFSLTGVAPGAYKAFAWEKLTGCCIYMEPAVLGAVDALTLGETNSVSIKLTAIPSGN